METSRAAVSELVATFALVFVGAGATIASGFGLDLTGVALAHGLVLGVMVSITARFGGGMVNPAASIGVWVAGRITTARAVTVVVAQLGGAVGAALLLRFLVPGTAYDSASGGTPTVASGLAPGKAIAIEAVCTFFYVFAVFGTIVDRRAPLGRNAGFAVGFVSAFALMAFGPFTGAAINPARWFGPAVASVVWDDWYVWIVGPVAGGIIAAVLYAAVFLRDRDPAPP